MESDNENTPANEQLLSFDDLVESLYNNAVDNGINHFFGKNEWMKRDKYRMDCLLSLFNDHQDGILKHLIIQPLTSTQEEKLNEVFLVVLALQTNVPHQFDLSRLIKIFNLNIFRDFCDTGSITTAILKNHFVNWLINQHEEFFIQEINKFEKLCQETKYEALKKFFLPHHPKKTAAELLNNDLAENLTKTNVDNFKELAQFFISEITKSFTIHLLTVKPYSISELSPKITKLNRLFLPALIDFVKFNSQNNKNNLLTFKPDEHEFFSFCNDYEKILEALNQSPLSLNDEFSKQNQKTIEEYLLMQRVAPLLETTQVIQPLTLM